MDVLACASSCKNQQLKTWFHVPRFNRVTPLLQSTHSKADWHPQMNNGCLTIKGPVRRRLWPRGGKQHDIKLHQKLPSPVVAQRPAMLPYMIVMMDQPAWTDPLPRVSSVQERLLGRVMMCRWTSSRALRRTCCLPSFVAKCRSLTRLMSKMRQVDGWVVSGVGDWRHAVM